MGQMKPLECAAGLDEPALGAAAGLGRWFEGVAVFLNAGVFQMYSRRSATTAHRALPVCEWPALGMQWGTARSDAATAVCSSSEASSSGRAEQVVCGGSGFGGEWRFPEEEAALGNHNAQSPASVWVASPGHAMGHCKVRCSHCCVQQF